MKSLIVSSFFLMVTAQVFAQYNLLFQHTSDQVSWNTSDAIADDGQGNTWLAGHFENSINIGPYTLTSVPSEIGSYVTTAFIGKYNSNSNSWQWMKKIALMLPQGSFNYSWINDIILDGAGNLYVTGIYSGTISFDGITLTSTKQGTAFSPDMFVAKYNSGGTAVWAKSFGSKIGMDWGKSIEIDISGNIYAAGVFTNKLVKCNGSVNYEQRDIFLVKLNNSGTSLWQKRYASNTGPCNGNNAATDLDLDVAGNPHISGNFVGTVVFGTGMNATSLGKEDIFVAKINSSGVTQWVRTAGTADYDYSNAIHVDASGGVYSGGRINSTSFITKYNSAGTSQWTVNPFPGKSVSRIIASGFDILVSGQIGFKYLAATDGTLIEYDSLSGYDVTGRTSIKDVENAGNGFVFNVTVQCGYNSIEDQAFTASCVNTCGVCFSFGDIGMVRNDGTPPIAFSIPVNESTLVPEEMELEIFPNPASDQLHVTLPMREKETTLFIQNQFGRTVWSEKIDSQIRTATINVDRQRFQSGIYYLISLSNGEVKTKRFVIDK
ncbi:MAG TPA: T9SS type A sorting domain-containing protein [Saprospiraceae bacterium]|nr:T9SS type A sorting domain-containing protein [Saprospiraceae bacterium]